MKFHRLLAVLLLVGLSARAQTELRVPGFTAYLEPANGDAGVSSPAGITGWDDPAQKVLWLGEIKTLGELDCLVSLSLPAGAETRLRLTVAGKSSEAMARGAGDKAVEVSFGSFDMAAAGYQKFMLESLNAAGKPAGDIEALVLSGRAAVGAHFNLKPGRGRAASSVHLMYPVPADVKMAAFYCEVTGLEYPTSTYYMACGWQRGYFGMQVNSPTERRIIFSVWDSGHEGVDRSKVTDTDRVTLVAKGDGVDAGDFGHEGTGGHSHLVYDWKTGEKQRFIVTAEPVDETHTIFSGYWFHPEQKKWMLISSWKASKDGGYLHDLYSFVEDFDGDNGQLRRKALYGNQWIRTDAGKWMELTTAKFSHDPTGNADRLDRFMGVEDGQFFLSTGGYIPGATEYGTPFTRPATGEPPVDFVPPAILEK